MKLTTIITNSLGNVFEWYDFALFTSFSGIFSKLFFPTHDHQTAILEVFGVFAIGFLCRPLGALIFGHLGDQIGRIKTLRLSILLITIPTLMMAIIPTYAQIGFAAPLILVLLRILQGMSIGGEFTGIIIYLTEMAPNKHRAFLASFAGTGANLGILAASGIVIILQLVLSSQNIELYGWRIAFLIGAILGLGLLYLRLGMTETQVFKNLVANKKINKLPVVTVIRQTPLILFRTIGLVFVGAILYYICFIYITEYLIGLLQINKLMAVKIQSICIFAMLFLVPLGGILCDKIGRRNSFLILTISLLILALPSFYLLNIKTTWALMIAMGCFTLFSSLEQGTTSATVVEQFPAAVRYTGISLSYNITQALFGGTAPLIAILLINYSNNLLAPAFYLMFAAFVTFITAFFFLSKKRFINLNE